MRFGLRELLFFVVLLTVPVASYFYLFKPRNESIKRAREEIAVKQANLEKLAEVSASIDDIGLAIEEGREKVELIEAKLPSEQDVEGILEQVWQLAKRNNLNVQSVKSDKPVPAALYMEQPLKMSMNGLFDGFYQFMLELENLPRITRVHQLKLERTDPRTATDKDMPPGWMKAEFILSIYFEQRQKAKL